jgi:hypothetical protein
MENIIDQLSPETIAFIEQAFGSVQIWLDIAATWTSEQLDALYDVITEDIHI